MQRRLIAALVGGLLAVGAWAQSDDKTPPINPDRPDQTDSAGITPAKRLVLELGYRQTRARGFTLHEYGDGQLVRYGVNDRFELRLGGTGYAIVRSDGGNAEGWEDGSAGFKWLLHEGKDNTGLRSPSCAVEFITTLPTGGEAFREKALQPTLTGIASFSIDDNSGLDVNLAATDAVEDGQRFTSWLASASYGRALADRVGAFLELYSLLPGSRRGPNDTYADTGVTYRLNNEMQLDAFAGSQLDRHRQSAFFGVGASFRF